MRPAGSSAPERTRSPAGVAGQPRTAASAGEEAMRSPPGNPQELDRAGSTIVSEMLTDAYIRMHPPIVGCTIYSIQGVAGLGTAGCAVAGLDLHYRPPG